MLSPLRFMPLMRALGAAALMASSAWAQTPQAPAPAPTATQAATASTQAAPTPGTLKLPDLPTGMCSVDPSQDADRSAIPDMHLATQGNYKLLAVFAECTNLKALRSGSSRVTSLNYYGSTVEQQGVTTPFDRAATLKALAAAISLTGAYVPEAAKPAGEQPSGLGPRYPSFQGLIKQTPNFIIVCTEQRHLVATKQFAMAAVSLITVLHGEIITVNFFAPAGEEQTYALLAGVAEAYGNQLIALNP